MATERQKEIKRRRHRRVKIKKLKNMLAGAKDMRERERLIEKIKRVSLSPSVDIS